MTSSDAAPRRLFTALFPDTDACLAIDAARSRWPGLPRRLRPALERMHLTLQFFGSVSAAHERAWRTELSGLRFEPFDVVLDRAEIWRAGHGAIVVLRPAASAALDRLHGCTVECARRAGLAPEPPCWKPHLTALRLVQRGVPLSLEQPIRWQARSVDLIASDLEAQPPRYRVLGRFGGQPNGAANGLRQGARYAEPGRNSPEVEDSG